MKKAIRLTESELKRIVRNCINEAMNEIGKSEKYQSLLGGVEARARDRYNTALFNRGKQADDIMDKASQTLSDVMRTKNKALDDVKGTDEYRKLKDANERGKKDYMHDVEYDRYTDPKMVKYRQDVAKERAHLSPDSGYKWFRDPKYTHSVSGRYRKSDWPETNHNDGLKNMY